MFDLGVSFGQAPQQPYAAIDRNAVGYSGPGRDAAHDLQGPEIRLGLLFPLSGPRQAQGEAWRRAAELAVEEANVASAGGPRFRLVARDEAGPWGQAATQIAHLVFDDEALAVITSAEGDSAHLAVQIGNKIGVPVLTLASDSTTTETNLPWIFRMVPGDEEQAQAFAQDIYRKRHFERVVLLTERDHDGRLGGEAFIRAAENLHAAPPVQMVIDAANAESAGAKELTAAEAVVIWTDAATARLLAARLRKIKPATPIYLCRKAAGGESPLAGRLAVLPERAAPQEVWIAAAPASPAARTEFENHYRQRFGVAPGIGAAETYDAVRILASALGRSGPNRARLRDALAAVSAYSGASGNISFDHAGNDISPVTVMKLK